MSVSKETAFRIACTLLDVVGQEKAILIIERLQVEVSGNKSFRDTLCAVRKCYDDRNHKKGATK